MTQNPKLRADILLVELGLASSRSQAVSLIKAGQVLFEGNPVTKPAQLVSAEALELQRDQPVYVGRGAHKLLGALERFRVSTQGIIAADVGASTGGFTQVLLEHGAQKVYAIDVGHGQLAAALKNDPRVVNMEGTNIRYLDAPEIAVDLAVIDLSYISLTLVLPAIFNLVKPSGNVIALVKPQFEVGLDKIGKNGLVKQPEHHLFALEKVFDSCLEQGWCPIQAIESPILGKTGNREFLFWIQPESTQAARLERGELRTLAGV